MVRSNLFFQLKLITQEFNELNLTNGNHRLDEWKNKKIESVKSIRLNSIRIFLSWRFTLRYSWH